MIVAVSFIALALAFSGCEAIDVNTAIDSMKVCAKELDIKEDVVGKLEQLIKSKMQSGDQDATKLQEAIKSQASQVLNSSGIGNKFNDLNDCVTDKMKV